MSTTLQRLFDRGGSRSAIWLVVAAACVSLCSAANGRLRIANADAVQVKGAFLYKFAHFVNWPEGTFADSAESIVIGILGKDPFGSFLDRAVAGRRAQKRPLRVRRFAKTEDLETCHILFVSSSQEDELEEIITYLRDRSILTVGDFEGFARRGGAIEFEQRGSHIELLVNLDAVSHVRLALSSRLLRLVNLVADEEQSDVEGSGGRGVQPGRRTVR